MYQSQKVEYRSQYPKRYMKYLEEKKKIDEENLFIKLIESQEPCQPGLARDRYGNCKEIWGLVK